MLRPETIKLPEENTDGTLFVKNGYHKKKKQKKKTQITNVGKDVEKQEPSYTIGRNVNWCSHCQNSVDISQKLKMELPYNSAIPPLDIYLTKMKTLI